MAAAPPTEPKETVQSIMNELGYKNSIADKYLKARKIHNIDVYRLMGNHNVLKLWTPSAAFRSFRAVGSLVCGFPSFLCFAFSMPRYGRERYCRINHEQVVHRTHSIWI